MGVAELEISPEAGDAVQRFLVLACSLASGGRLAATDVNSALDEAGVPALKYSLALRLLTDAGIEVEQPESIEDDDLALGPPVDGFGAFVRRTSHRVLTFEEEQALGRRIDHGRLAQQVLLHDGLDDAQRRDFSADVRDGRNAEDDLARHNQRLVFSIAKQFESQCRAGMTYEDLVQEGWLGLGRAISKWEYQRGLKFSTYATWWIRQHIDRALADQGRVIRLPVHFRDELRRVLKAERRLYAEGEDVTVTAIAEQAEIPPTRVKEVLRWRTDARSLDRPLGDGGFALADTVADDSDVEREVDQHLLASDVRRAVEELQPKEQRIIRLRFGLEDGRRWTLEEVGREFGVTRERIRQIESKTLAKLRHPQRSGHLRTYLGDD